MVDITKLTHVESNVLLHHSSCEIDFI